MLIHGPVHGFLWQHPTVNNCNTYLIAGDRPVLVDPGHADVFGHVVAGLRELGMGVADLALVIATHGHPDHMEAAGAIARESGAPFAVHRADWSMAREVARELGLDVAEALDRMEPAFFLGEGDLEVGAERLSILHVPGHSPGSVAIWHPDSGCLIPGDLLFADGVGRTDLPGGDAGMLGESVQRLKALPAERLLPGHGPVCFGAAEVRRAFERAETVWLPYV